MALHRMFSMKTGVYCCVILAAFGLTNCHSGKATPEGSGEKLTLPVVELLPQKTQLHKEYVSTLEAVRNVEIRARVSGFLERIHVDEGQRVHKGQVLFSLNTAEYQVETDKAQAALKTAQAEAKTAEVEVSRVKLLLAKNVVSPSEMELAKAKLEAARAGIDEARSMLEAASLRLTQAHIRAPFDGVINRIPYKIGSLIEAGALLTTVSDIREVFAYFDVSEREYLGFVKNNKNLLGKGGQEVEILLADETLYPIKGRIEAMESTFEGESGTIAFRARFANPDQLLKHGSSGKIRLVSVVPDAILVPQKAVFEIQDRNYVYVVDKAGRVKSRHFIPQNRVGKHYLVKSGLQAGDRVVYEGIQNIREGEAITAQVVAGDSLADLPQSPAVH